VIAGIILHKARSSERAFVFALTFVWNPRILDLASGKTHLFRDKYGREWQGPLPFTPEGIDFLEEKSRLKSGLYQILYKSQLAYIGVSSVSVFDRLRSHLRRTGNKMMARRTTSDFYEFACWFCDGKIAKQIESYVRLRTSPALTRKPNIRTTFGTLRIISRVKPSLK
jgi:hypothetical protein